VTGLVVQPIVGYLSDRTWNRLGRAASVLPHRSDPRLAGAGRDANSPAALWVAPASLDHGRLDNISMEPFRAFGGRQSPVGAANPPAYAMQSFFIGTARSWFGAAMASHQAGGGEHRARSV